MSGPTWTAACGFSNECGSPSTVELGDAALQALAERPFDLVLLDLRMPNLSGEQVCRRVRFELGLDALPITIASTSLD